MIGVNEMNFSLIENDYGQPDIEVKKNWQGFFNTDIQDLFDEWDAISWGLDQEKSAEMANWRESCCFDEREH